MRASLGVSAAAVTTVLSSIISSSHAYSFQSGPNKGSVYASSMVFDSAERSIHLTGITYDQNIGKEDALSTPDNPESSCFVASISIDNFDQGFSVATALGNANVLETCSGIAVHKPSDLILVGNSEKGGLHADETATMSGFALALDRLNLTQYDDHDVTLIGKEPFRIPYPIDVVVDNDDLYIVSLKSTDNEPADYPTDAQPNWILHPKYGSSFDMDVAKVKLEQQGFDGVTSGPDKFALEWVQEFPVNPSADGTTPRVYIGGVILKHTGLTSVLIVAGSTRGLGNGYGFGTQGDSDEDGFVTLLDTETGNLIQKGQARIGSTDDDVVAGICHDDNDYSSFYVVGATKGQLQRVSGGTNEDQKIPDGSLQAFVMKMNVVTLTPIWTVQWGAVKSGKGETSAEAIDCEVVDDVVYVAGDVQGGASMVQDRTKLPSKGEDDVWVAQLRVDDGHVNWMQQLGTSGKESIAPYGALVADDNGDIFLYGDTTGEFFLEGRSPTEHTEVFVAHLDQNDGSYDGGNAAPFNKPSAPVPAPTNAPVPSPTMAPVPAPGSVQNGGGHQNGSGGGNGIAFRPVGIQLKGPAFAGGLVYDDHDHALLITGGIYSNPSSNSNSNCFLASFMLRHGIMESYEEFGSTQHPEACSAIAYSPFEDKIFAAGNAEQNGFLSDSISSPNANNYGYLIETYDDEKLYGFGVDDNAKAQYPVAVIPSPTEDYVIVVSAASTSSSEKQINSPFHDYTTGELNKWGEDFFVGVRRYAIQEKGDGDPTPSETLQKAWYESYKTAEGDATVTGAILVDNGNTLVVVGHTDQSGGAFGTNAGDDMDGFILKLDPETGKLVEGDQKASTRLDSINHGDDYVMGVCADKFDLDAFYVVGTSSGKIRNLPDDQQPPEGSSHPFIAKIHASSLTSVWLKHFTFSNSEDADGPDATAYGCAVSPAEEGGSNIVYVAGVTENDGDLIDGAVEEKAAGLADIFVVQLDGYEGNINWARQVGSTKNDYLARGNGGVDVDRSGNAIIYGETEGDFFDSNDSNRRDIIVFTMSKEDGSYREGNDNGFLGWEMWGGHDENDPDKPSDPSDFQEGDGGTDEDDDYVDPNEVVTGNSGDTTDLEPTVQDLDKDNVLGFQSGPDVGPTYAGGMFFDQALNALYLTGSTYGHFGTPGNKPYEASSCYLGVMRLPRLQWQDRGTYGVSNVPQACNSLVVKHHRRKRTAFVIGSTEQDGLLTDLGFDDKAVQIGLVAELVNDNGGFKLSGGVIMDESKVQFPIGIHAKDSDKHLFIASMVSSDDKVTPDYEKVKHNEFPNLTTGGIEKYGSDYQLVIEKYTIKDDTGSNVPKQTLQRDWSRPFETADGESIFVSALISTKKENTLIVVGSTRATKGSNDMNGIVAKVSPSDGNFLDENTPSVATFKSSLGGDDWIMNACPDPKDKDSFYIVGATRGLLDATAEREDSDVTVHAVVAKIRTTTLETFWIKQFAVKHASGKSNKQAAAAALACDVIPGEGLMYVAGNVENGATMDYDGEEFTNAGGDDIFVAQLNTDNGSLVWMKQMGSNGDDRIARGGGLKVNNLGDAVVFGDTNGSMYRTRNGDLEPKFSDIFVSIFRKEDGAFQMPLQVTTPVSPGSSTPSEWYPNGGDLEPKSSSSSFAVFFFIILALIGLFYFIERNRRRRQAESQKSQVFAYLQKFEVEDIDLRKSPPGGWHGTYLNKLAYGVNKAESEGNNMNYSDGVSLEATPLTHSSIVSDSLFMDRGSSPYLGGYDDLQPREYGDEYDRTREII